MDNVERIYENDNLLVINKPSGVTVNRAFTVSGPTIADWIDKNVESREEDEVFVARSGMAHRLDKETSGCLLIAKNAKTLEGLLLQFKERKIKKEYLALVHGKMLPQGTVKLPLKRNRGDRKKWAVAFDGKEAETAWKVEGYFLNPKNELGGEMWSLVRLFPKTGRTHQIRVHLSHLGHPLVSDLKYLNHKKVGADRRLLARHALHAAALEFSDPNIEKRIKVEAPMSADMKRLIESLRRVDEV